MTSTHEIVWLHLSDLHICNPRHGWDADRVTETLVEDLQRLQHDEGLRPDLIFFTGDAAFGQIGQDGEKTVAVQLDQFATFLEEVRTAFEPSVALSDVFLVPGNHDVNRDWVEDAQTEWLETREEKREPEKVFSMVQGGGLQWRRYMERLRDYRAFLEKYGFAHLLTDPDRLIWSTIREVRGHQIGLAGFNTAWSCCRDGERGHLWMAGKWQQETLRQGLKGAEFSIALMHHPPDWLVEYENPQFGRGLENQFKFMLHGHEHQGWVRSTASGYTVVAGGACYDRSDSKLNGYNFVRLDPSSGEGKVWLRQYDSEGGGWVKRPVHGRADDGVWPLTLDWLKGFAASRATAEPKPEEEPIAAVEERMEPPADDPELTRYLQRLRATHRDLPLAGFETRVRLPIQISDVYMPLRARIQHTAMDRDIHRVGALRELEELCDGLEGVLPFDEALIRAREHDLHGCVVLGDPGSGKTTLLKHYVLAVTDPVVGPAALGLPDATVPVLIELRRLKDPTLGLKAALEESVSRVDMALDTALDAAEFTRKLLCGPLLILVDGLDEVADERQRSVVSRWLEEGLKQLPESTFVVTSRYAGYKRDARLQGRFLELHVQDVEEDAARRFIAAWYLAVESQAELGRDGEQSRQIAAEGSEALSKKIFDQSDKRVKSLRDLARNPLMLQILCLVHRDRQRLPERRVELYRECVKVLLELWRGAKGMNLTFDAPQALRLLQPLAWYLHSGDRREADLDDLLPQLEEPLRGLGRDGKEGRGLLEAIRDQSGVLVSLGNGAYGFLHLSFQEYLAALYVQDRSYQNPSLLRELACHFGDPWWREVILLVLGLHNPSMFVPLMGSVISEGRLHADVSLADDCLRDALETSPTPFLQALSRGISDSSERYHALRLLRHLEGWQDAEVDGRTGIEVVRRLSRDDDAQVRGMVQELLGTQARSSGPQVVMPDPVIVGVTVSSPTIFTAGTEMPHGVDGSVLVYVPGGRFPMGTDQDLEGYIKVNEGWPKPAHEVVLSGYWIGKYPVTNAQYGGFLEAHPGHNKPEYWTDKQFNGSDQPVVGVSWADALAYCEWAGLSLPSEAEWEAAARGKEGRPYPWGDFDPSPELANYGDREGHPTPVGAYPKGAGPYGTLDQAGNVWEWCLDEFEPDAYKGRDGTKDPIVGDPEDREKVARRVVRGGSWASSALSLPAAFRLGNGPGHRDLVLGFRVVCRSVPEP